MIEVTVNGRRLRFDGDGYMPLLWFLREEAGLKGTKFGCGIGSCGACTVHVNGRAVKSCVTPMQSLEAGDRVTTIEGLAANGELHPVQQAWLEEDVPQCGYCQAGQIMAAVAFLETHPVPVDEEIDRGIDNLCRCGTYNRIRKAIHRAALMLRENSADG